MTRTILPLSHSFGGDDDGGGHHHLAVAGAFRQSEGEKGVGDALGRWQAAGVFAGEGSSAQPGAHDAWVDQVRANARFGDFSGVILTSISRPALLMA